MLETTNPPQCPRCDHTAHSGMKCVWPITRTFRDDVSFTGYPPSGRTLTILEGYCDCE